MIELMVGTGTPWGCPHFFLHLFSVTQFYNSLAPKDHQLQSPYVFIASALEVYLRASSSHGPSGAGAHIRGGDWLPLPQPCPNHRGSMSESPDPVWTPQTVTRFHILTRKLLSPSCSSLQGDSGVQAGASPHPASSFSLP